ncbi:MAG TPA: cytochrome P460 family protein [Gaiellaceae bacterium]|nr:cytochrome P460 family protein [Gaiellaceae bacterium]
MRWRIVAIVVVAALAASAVVVAVASTSAAGLPAYTNGYQKWPKINRKPFKSTGPLSSAHQGVKNVYASKRKVGTKYPNGTVIVKSIAKAGDKPSLPGDVAVMRKVNGRWRYVEYRLSGSRYAVLAQGQLCQSCHAQARANDYVFTKR